MNQPVVPLRELVPEVNEDAAELLRSLLARVESGEAVAVGIIEVQRGGVVATAYSNSRSGHYHALNSGAARLANRLAAISDG
jgi:hypothetical protein